MILAMAKLRIMGPRQLLPEVLNVVQDTGLLHVAPVTPDAHLAPLSSTPKQLRLRRYIRRGLADIEVLQSKLGKPQRPTAASQSVSNGQIARWCRLARRTRREAERLDARIATGEEERTLIVKYRGLFATFQDLSIPSARWELCRAYHVLLQAGQAGTVIFSGAGISTESGIPDFRSPGGLWTRYAPIDYTDYLRDAEMRRESWRRGLHTYATMVDARPNAAHLAIADWWRQGLLNGVVTQNIDGLHHKAGLPAEAVVELHGNAHSVSCLTCGACFERLAVHARVLAGD